MKEALTKRITDYLSNGGLFNPELANHIAVRDLLIECREALAQPEQSENSDFQPDWMNYQQGYMDGMSQAIADMALEKDKPQRTWVGLTNEDIDGFVKQYWNDELTTMRSMIKDAEAKLKEKNT